LHDIVVEASFNVHLVNGCHSEILLTVLDKIDEIKLCIYSSSTNV